MDLYLVAADDANGDNRDVFVWAESHDHAKDLYLAGEYGDDLSPGDQVRVFLAPHNIRGPIGIVKWADPEVFYK